MNENSNATAADLAKYDFIICIDRSGSMGTKEANGKSRWQIAEESTVALARKAAEHDTDGATVCIFGGSTIKSYENITGAEDKVAQIFKENEPAGGTPTDKVLAEHLNKYMTAKKAGNNPKPILIACITDGQPDDENAVAKIIVETTKSMATDDEIGITFLQVGNDSGATAFLQKLDDDLTSQGAAFDIVDTKKLEEVENLTDTWLNALND